MTSFKILFDYIRLPFVFIFLVILAFIITVAQALWDFFKNPVWFDFSELVRDMWNTAKGNK